tara:strand:- start:71930 stop:72532 length:603 start_codon:yes stop_codon:yes gene_type:complete
MMPAVFKAAIEFCEDYGSNITIGGGEPTLHPRFWEYFGKAMSMDVESVWMATNGSVTKTVKGLAHIAEGSHKFGIALSQDSWHDPIEYETIRMFEDLGLEIRNNDEHIINKGAAFDNGIGMHDGCGCADIQIAPDGVMKMCGCPDSLVLGNIMDIDEQIIDRVQEIGEDCGNCGDDLDPDVEEYILGKRDEYNIDCEAVG